MQTAEVHSQWRPAARYAVLFLGLGLLDFVLIHTFPWAKDTVGRTLRFFPLAALGAFFTVIGSGLQARPIARRLGLGFPIDGSTAQGQWRLWDQVAQAFTFFSVALAFVALKRLTLTYAPPNMLTDTAGYLQVAGNSPTEAAFWLGQRPWTVPLFYRLLGATTSTVDSPHLLGRVVLFQGALSTVAWLLLASAVASTTRARWLRPFFFGMIAIFGLCLHISQWDTVLLSESISTSMFIMMIGLGVVMLRGPYQRNKCRRWVMLLMTPAIVLYIFTRDTNAYFLLLASSILGLITIIKMLRVRPTLWLTVSLLGFALLVSVGQLITIRASERSRGAFYGTFLQRVLLEPNRKLWFEHAGMPLGSWWERMNPSITRVAFYQAVTSDPEAEPFVNWMDRHGRSTYLRYWFSHPMEAVRLPLADWDQLLSPDSTEYRGDGAVTPSWLRLLTSFFYPLSTLGFSLMVAGSILAIMMLWTLGEWRSWWYLPVGLLVLSLPMMFFVWHADSIEIERHAFQIALQVRLAFWLLVAAIADAFLGPWLFPPLPSPNQPYTEQGLKVRDEKSRSPR